LHTEITGKKGLTRKVILPDCKTVVLRSHYQQHILYPAFTSIVIPEMNLKLEKQGCIAKNVAYYHSKDCVVA